MKVLQINSFFSVGGPPRIVKGIYDTLIENGHDCILAAGREQPIDGMKIIKIGTPINKYWHLIMSRLFDAQGLSSKHATKKLLRQIEEYNPDVIHLHNLHGYYLNYDILFDFLKRIDKPVIWTLHDCWPMTGHCAHFDYIGCMKWKTLCYDCPQKKEYPRCDTFDCSERNYLKKKTAFTGVRQLTIVTPSNWLAEIVKQSFLSEYPVKVINNGIDLEVFKPLDPAKNDFKERYSMQDKTLLLGVAQNWSKKKGLDDFLELSKKLDDTYQIVMVGLTEKQLKNLPSNIIGITRTNNTQELVQIYSTADVFINLTIEDNFPTVNLEALACGTPVMTYKTGGSPECIDDSCGVVIEQGDINKIISTIKNMEENAFKRDNCIFRAEEYEKAKRYNDYLLLYDYYYKGSYI